MNAKILVVEDEPSISLLIKDDLLLEGYEVVMARDGEEGLKMALEEAPDVVVLDVMLPKRSGYEVCRQIKAHRKHLPIILLTAKGQESDKLAGFDMGADDYMTKPFSMLELLARIKVALRNSRYKQDGGMGKRVAAIVMTDIIGYTRKAGAVSQNDLMRLMKAHHGLLEAAAKTHHGRVINTVADSSVLLFESVTEALEAALQVQRDHRQANQREAREDQRLTLHVGVHVGEVTLGAQGHEVYGDAVNVAARAAKITGEDAVCVTEAARLALPHQRDGLEDLGPQSLKGVETPVHLYRIRVP